MNFRTGQPEVKKYSLVVVSFGVSLFRNKNNNKNQDNKITAGELHQYVQENVVQQSSGSQTPELQGDKNRVLVQFQ